jgi:hypothetical protein
MKYKIAVTFRCGRYFEVEAENEKKAREMAHKEINSDYPFVGQVGLTDGGYKIDDIYEI